MGFANATAEARYAIDYGVARAELSMPAQLEFDQLTAQGYKPQRRAASGIANDRAVLTPPAAPAQARAATRPRLRPSATNIIRSGWCVMMLPFGLVAFSVGANWLGILLTLSCVGGLAYYLLPWEVWVQNYVYQQDAEAGLTSDEAAQE